MENMIGLFKNVDEQSLWRYAITNSLRSGAVVAVAVRDADTCVIAFRERATGEPAPGSFRMTKV